MVWILAGIVLLAAVLFFAVRSGGPEQRDNATVTLREEQLQLRKTREELADVTMRREVSRELKTVTVPVTKTELVVEKDGVEAARIPLCEEQVDVATRPVPLNDVSVYRREWKEDREIQAVLKKEVARIETTGAAQYSEVTAGGDESHPQG